jgi:hypothetical protein
LSLRTQTTVNVGENAGDKRNPYAVGGKINKSNHYGMQYGGSSKSSK